MINLSYYLIINACLFGISLAGIILSQKNLIFLIIFIELMLLAVNNNFIAYARLWNDINGQIIVLFILSCCAVEIAIGLAILLKLFKHRASVNIMDLTKLKY